MKTAHIAVMLLLSATLIFSSDKGFKPPPAGPAISYPAHETHNNEDVSIAIDPFTSADKAAIFKVKYREYGFLPVRLIITNDGNTPLMLDDMKIEYITGEREKLEPAVLDDIFRRISRPEKAVSRPKIQLPIPMGHGKDPVGKEARDEVPVAMFSKVPVTPHSTNSGFLFFDVSGISDPEDGAHIYISGIKAGTQELFYFDIPLRPDQQPNQPPSK
ncbi:MAG TPA: hypothetical protein VFP59_01265 [Candidatus Angelobacter sp.]|nr:hypothetical protein [Candidatus Angelobacter sp.]